MIKFKKPAKTVGYVVVELTGDEVCTDLIARDAARTLKNDFALAFPEHHYRIARVVLDK